MIRKIWEDIFKGEAEELLGFSKEDTNEIIDLFIIDKINPQIFQSNMEVLKYGVSAWSKPPTASHSILNPPKTPIGIPFWSLANRPHAMPLWFLAAYPDVVVWWDEQQEKHNRSQEQGMAEFIKLFGIKEDAEDFIDDKGKTRPKYLKNLVQSYKGATGMELETAIKITERPVLSEDTLKRMREAGLNPDEMTNDQLAAFDGWENIKKSHWLSKWLSYASIFLGLGAIINLLTLDFGGFVFFGVTSLLLMYVAYRIQRRVSLKRFNEASRRKPVMENKPPNSSKKRILVVDDEENIRLLYQEELQEEGYEVETASDGVEALEMLDRKGPFDLVTTCIRMPGMDGISLVRKIKERNQDLPIIILTAMSEFKQDFPTWEADAFIVKNPDLSELKDTIKKILSPEAITENKRPQNTSIERAVPIMCVTNEYLYSAYLLDHDKSLKFKMQKFMEQNGKAYDVLCFEKTPGEEVNLYFDISSFYGKGGLTIPPSLNLPPPGEQIALEEIISDEIDLWGKIQNLNTLKVFFRPYSSEMISMYVVIWRNSDTVYITPIRAYDKETGVLILHGYHFWRLMLEHQLQHILDDHQVATTETEVKADYYKPVIGIDCIRFKPLPSFNFSNDLINYTFFTHRPNAFESNHEVEAFGASLRLGFSRELFTIQEIEQSIIRSEVDIVPRKLLIDMANFAFKEVQTRKSKEED